MKILGHRGARAEHLENSQVGFEYVQKLAKKPLASNRNALAGIEFDVQLTADGELAVFHDENLLRLFKKQNRLDQLQFAELSHHSKSQILPLSAMPDLLLGYQHIELEIKTHTRTPYSLLMQGLNESLSQYFTTLQPVLTITTFDHELQYRMSIHPKISQWRRGLLVDKLDADTVTKNDSVNATHASNQTFIDLAQKFGCRHISWHFKRVTKATIDACHRHGFTTSAWTVNDIDTAKYLSQMGLDYVITDYPTSFLRLLPSSL